MVATNPGEHRVAVLAFPGISPFHLAAPYAVLQGTARTPLPLPYRLVTCAEHPGPVPTSAGWPVVVEHGLDALAAADTVVLPSWDTTRDPSPALLTAVADAHRRGARIVGLCLGAFVVARAGIADGREVATHWAAAAELTAVAPAVRVRADVLWCDEGDVVTSAGVAAGLDCLLHLVRTDLGAAPAAAVARSLVLAPHRDGSQAQFIPAPLRPAPGNDLFDDALTWALEHLAERIGLDAWASRAAMSRRTFTRRFRERAGTSPGAWLLDQRLLRARELLETTDRPVDTIAAAVGFATGASLRAHFAERFGTTPGRHRRAFAA